MAPLANLSVQGIAADGGRAGAASDCPAASHHDPRPARSTRYSAPEVTRLDALRARDVCDRALRCHRTNIPSNQARRHDSYKIGLSESIAIQLLRRARRASTDRESEGYLRSHCLRKHSCEQNRHLIVAWPEASRGQTPAELRWICICGDAVSHLASEKCR